MNSKSRWYVLQFRGIAVSDAGRYLCHARNSAGEADAVAEVVVSGKLTSFILKVQGVSIVGRELLATELFRETTEQQVALMDLKEI
jgi:hypothetical protein